MKYGKFYSNISTTIYPHWNLENIRKSGLDFTALFGEINPDMPYLCRRSLSGPERAVFASFPSVRWEAMKKNVKSTIFCEKTSKFLRFLSLSRKLLIVNRNLMLYRQIDISPQAQVNHYQESDRKTVNEHRKNPESQGVTVQRKKRPLQP